MIDFLKREISNAPRGMISYSYYIQLALYHPEWGYYMKEKEKVGRKGDFITTSNFSDIYGRLIAKWYIKQVKEKGLEPFVLEIGAGNGRFAVSFIDEWERRTDIPLEYYIVEESPYHRELQRQLLTFDHHVKQVSSLEELKPFAGLIFSNELFDALPVHVIEKNNGSLKEVMISIEEDSLVEKLVPLEDERIISFLKDSRLTLSEKQRIEIPLAMEKMITRISDTLKQGFVLTVDYGYHDEEWMLPARRDGSLRGYYKHQQVNNCLLHPGEMDITSHVHFDSFIKYGEETGLHLVDMLRQDEFFLKIGILEEFEEHYDRDPFSTASKRNRAIKGLIMPNGISSYFHVILQEKGLDARITG